MKITVRMVHNGLVSLNESERERLLREVRTVVDETIEIITSREFEDGFWVENFPCGSCEITSVAVGRRLLDLGYGDADLVNYSSGSEDGFFTQSQNHVWLELQLEDGEFISIDATAHQFPRLASAPVVTVGKSPLRVAFRQEVRRSKISAPYEWHFDRFHAPILEYVEGAFKEK